MLSTGLHFASESTQPLYWRIRDQVEFFADLRDCGGQAPVEAMFSALERGVQTPLLLRHRDAELMRHLWRQGKRFTGALPVHSGKSTSLSFRVRGNDKATPNNSIRERVSRNACSSTYSAAVLLRRAVKLSAQRRPGSPPHSSQAI